MSHDFIGAFHRLAFFRMVPVPKLLGIVRDARVSTTVTDSLHLIRRRLLSLLPPDDAARLDSEVERADHGRLTVRNVHKAPAEDDHPWHVVTLDPDAVALFRALERLLADPPPAEEWSETLAYLEHAVRDVTRGGVSG